MLQQAVPVLVHLTTRTHDPITSHKETIRAASSNYTQPSTMVVHKVAVTKAKIGDLEVLGHVCHGSMHKATYPAIPQQLTTTNGIRMQPRLSFQSVTRDPRVETHHNNLMTLPASTKLTMLVLMQG